MNPALVEAAKAVGTEGLHDADVHVGVVVAQEGFAVELDEAGKPVQIMIEELLAEFRGQVGFGVVEERGDVVLESALAAALVIDEVGIAVAKHDVAGLEVAIEKVIAGGAEKEFGEAAEIVFEGGFDLEAREDGDDFAIGFDYLGSDVRAGTIFGEELEERGVAKVFFEISAVAEVFGVNFRNGKAVATKVFGEFEESGVFFTDAVENADGAFFLACETDDLAAGTAEFALERHDALWRCVEMLLEELFENVQGHWFQPFRANGSMKLTFSSIADSG